MNLTFCPMNNGSCEFWTFIIIMAVAVYNTAFAMILIVITIITVPVTIIIVNMLVILVFIIVVIALRTINFINTFFLSTILSTILPSFLTKSGQKDFNVRGAL